MKAVNGALPVLICALVAGCSMLGRNTSGNEFMKMQQDAQVAFDNGENTRAETLYKALIRTSPNDAEAWLRLGNLYARTDHPEQAVDAYLKSLSLNESDPRTWHNLGVIRMRQAWAALLRANAASAMRDPVHTMSGEMMKALEQMPYLSNAELPKPASGADQR